MRWDFGFFIKNIPPAHTVLSDRLRVAALSEVAIRDFEEIKKMHPALHDFRPDLVQQTVRMAIARVEGKTLGDAFELAWRLLGHVVDWWAFVCDQVPEIAPVLLSREGTCDDLEIRAFQPQACFRCQATFCNSWSKFQRF